MTNLCYGTGGLFLNKLYSFYFGLLAFCDVTQSSNDINNLPLCVKQRGSINRKNLAGSIGMANGMFDTINRLTCLHHPHKRQFFFWERMTIHGGNEPGWIVIASLHKVAASQS